MMPGTRPPFQGDSLGDVFPRAEAHGLFCFRPLGDGKMSKLKAPAQPEYDGRGRPSHNVARASPPALPEPLRGLKALQTSKLQGTGDAPAPQCSTGIPNPSGVFADSDSGKKFNNTAFAPPLKPVCKVDKPCMPT